MKPFYILFFFLFAELSSCRKVSTEKSNAHSLSQIFEDFWCKMKNNYVFWPYDTVNWNSTHQQYQALFSKLDYTKDQDLLIAADYFKGMTKNLIDGHLNITFKHPLLKTKSIFPSLARKENSPLFHAPFPYTTIIKKYLDTNFTEYLDTTVNPSQYLLLGTIQHKIVYFNCNRFSLAKSYASNFRSKQIIESFFQLLKSANSTALKGVIIDLRNNSGGDFADLNFFIGSFISSPLSIGYTSYKNGSSPFAHTPWIESFVQPSLDNNIQTSLPIIVLIDNYTSSLAELAAMSIARMPNSITIGETTWGATGIVTSSDIYESGSFTVTDFLSVECSSVAFKYNNGKIYESTGFPPDFPIPFDTTFLNKKIDPILEKAVSLVH